MCCAAGLCSAGSTVTCDDCLQLSPQCAWCTQENFTDWFSVTQRCDTLDVLLEKGCARDLLQFPVSKHQILQDQPLGKKMGSTNSTQIFPQKMSLKLRPGMQSDIF
uniref:PSI domain-containing protein n=1 Tax=Pundamilia nyererei TaxID=303518 RepID=A0A3B4ES66_9CICH